MPTPFAKLAVAAQGTLDRVFAEGFTLEPRERPSGVNGRPAATVSRPTVSFCAIYSTKALETQTEGRGKSGDWTSKITAEESFIDCARAGFGDELPREGDTVIRIETGERFKIARGGEPVDPGRILFPLRRADL